jgi:biopolymer transport protein TolR
LNTNEVPLVVSVTRDGQIYLNDVSMDVQTLTDKLTAIRQEKPTQIVYLRGDTAASYGLVVGVIAALKSAGIEQLGMITEPEAG